MQRLNRQCGTDRNALNARFSVMTCRKKLGLPSFVEIRAVTLFTKLRAVVKGQKGITEMAAASVYMACREGSITRTMGEICDTMNSSKKRSWRYYRDMHEIVRPTLPLTSPAGFVTRLASDLGLPIQVSKKALKYWKTCAGTN